MNNNNWRNRKWVVVSSWHKHFPECKSMMWKQSQFSGTAGQQVLKKQNKKRTCNVWLSSHSVLYMMWQLYLTDLVVSSAEARWLNVRDALCHVFAEAKWLNVRDALCHGFAEARWLNVRDALCHVFAEARWLNVRDALCHVFAEARWLNVRDALCHVFAEARWLNVRDALCHVFAEARWLNVRDALCHVFAEARWLNVRDALCHVSAEARWLNVHDAFCHVFVSFSETCLCYESLSSLTKCLKMLPGFLSHPCTIDLAPSVSESSLKENDS